MYHSDHELYMLAQQKGEELRRRAAGDRLAASCRKSGPKISRTWRAQVGAILISIGHKLQEE